MGREEYNTKDLGVVVDETDQAVDTYAGDPIPMRETGWGKMALDVTLVNSELKVLARASKESATYRDGTERIFGVATITTTGYYEMVDATEALDLKFQWTTSDTTNTTKVAALKMRP